LNVIKDELMKQAIAEAQRKEPFEPFDIEMVGGMMYHVPHPEFVYITPGKSVYFVWTSNEGVPVALNSMLVASVRPSKSSQGRRRKAG